MMIGMCCQPRTVEVGASSMASWSTSHSGKRFRNSSSATRPFETGERGAEAVVDAPPEREVRRVFAVDVEHVGRVVVTGVAVGRADQEQHGAARRNGRAVVLDVVGDDPCGGVAGGFEPQRFLDHLGDERAVLHDVTTLVGVLGEELGEPADEPSGGLVAGARDAPRCT